MPLKRIVDLIACGIVFAILSIVPAFILTYFTYWFLYRFIGDYELVAVYAVLSWTAMMYCTFKSDFRRLLRRPHQPPSVS